MRSERRKILGWWFELGGTCTSKLVVAFRELRSLWAKRRASPALNRPAGLIIYYFYYDSSLLVSPVCRFVNQHGVGDKNLVNPFL